MIEKSSDFNAARGLGQLKQQRGLKSGAKKKRLEAMEWMSVAAGFAVGSIVGLCGVGGGSLMTPLLTLGLGVPPLAAVGTDLAFAAATKAVGAAAHRRQATVSVSAAGWLCLGALPAALAAGIWLSAVGEAGRAPDRWLYAAIAIATGSAALALALRPFLAQWGADRGDGMSDARRRGCSIILGALIGALVTLTSVGAGAIGAAALALLYPRLRAAEVAGTDLAFALPLATLAAGLHWWMGSVDWALAGLLLLGSVPGAALGAWLSTRLPEALTRGALILALGAACASTLAKAL